MDEIVQLSFCLRKKVIFNNMEKIAIQGGKIAQENLGIGSHYSPVLCGIPDVFR
jgi:hypothetical protein